ncbi:MAG TPA: stress protein, partial [Rhodobacteraceae bacterium]|nr:stress protein [Paracoccaceae bacterium]
MILHAVFCNVLARVSTSERAEVFERLSKLSKSLDGVLSFEAG